MMKIAVRATLATIVLLDPDRVLVYPLAITGVGQLAFKDKANGSLVEVDGSTVGQLADRAGVGGRAVVLRPAVRDRLRRVHLVGIEPRAQLDKISRRR